MTKGIVATPNQNTPISQNNAIFRKRAPSAELCRGCGMDHDVVRANARYSLFFTARAICGYRDMTVHFHQPLAEWVERNLREGRRKMMVLASRVYFKTSLLTQAFSIWCIINNPNVRILIMQQSQDKVKDVMHKIKSILKSSAFAHYFPELVPRPTDRFSDIKIDVPRTDDYPEPTISAYGISSGITGGHYDVHIIDDIIGQEQAESEVEMEAAIRWFKNSNPLFTHYVNGVRMVVGTRWAMNDLYQYIKDIGGHEIIEVGARWDERAERSGIFKPHPSGQRSLFPERYPDDVLERMEAETDPVVWSYQYLNVPIVKTLQRFEREHFRYGKWVDYGKIFVTDDGRQYDVRKAGVVSIMVDPSLGRTAESDEFAITVCAWWPQYADAAVLETYHARIPPIQQSDQIIRMYRKWRSFGCRPVVGVERVAYQEALIAFTQDRQRQAQTYFYIEPISTGARNKARRIEALQPYYANHQIIHVGEHDALEAQLLGFQPRKDGSTGLAHDDLIDSLAYHVKYWKGVNYEAKARINTNATDTDEWVKEWLSAEGAQPNAPQQPEYSLVTTT